MPDFALAGENGTLSKSHFCAPVAQLDRAVASEATGREFESLRAHHKIVLRSSAFRARTRATEVRGKAEKTATEL
jgi:hypothetical protein